MTPLDALVQAMTVYQVAERIKLYGFTLSTNKKAGHRLQVLDLIEYFGRGSGLNEHFLFTLHHVRA
ncbi:MAG: hypothetical protein ACKOCZ_09790 [Betaproteobacteria bacterium]